MPSNHGDTKVYTTKVKINNDFPGLRPGMSARAEILIAKRENVLSRAGWSDTLLRR